jgi:hypothetical protein
VAVLSVDLLRPGRDAVCVSEAQGKAGTAVTMPDPGREVGRAVSHLIRDGTSRFTANVTVANAAAHAASILAEAGITDTPWLTQLRDIALDRARHAGNPRRDRDSEDDEPASAIAAQWATDITDLARARGVIGKAEG